MSVCYRKLFHLMIDKGISNSELVRKGNFSPNLITRIKKGDYIALNSIERICSILDCGVDDILEFVEDSKEV